jgi:DNA-binding NtrC family response regulator
MAPHLLLVDDDAELLKALTKVLEKEGFTVTASPHANGALELARQRATPFDAVITDISMPGMSGTDLLVVLKKEYPAMPVLVITAFGDWGGYMTALREGACEYLNKPIEKAELLAAVRRALANQCRLEGKSAKP